MKTVMTSLLFVSCGMEKRRICSSLFSYDLLTTNTSSLVDVEVGQNCEPLWSLSF